MNGSVDMVGGLKPSQTSGKPRTQRTRKPTVVPTVQQNLEILQQALFNLQTQSRFQIDLRDTGNGVVLLAIYGINLKDGNFVLAKEVPDVQSITTP